MFNSPRRPYYNRNTHMPPSSQNDDSAKIETKRFWSLLKDLRKRQEQVQTTQNQAKSAKTS